jgi:transcriptional regulator with XRE-family HTH domain
MVRAPIPSGLESIADRLRLSREALGYSITTMARFIGGQPSLWHNYETGLRRISVDKALLLKRATGLTLEWIYTGDVAGLPQYIAEKIEQQLAKEADKD